MVQEQRVLWLAPEEIRPNPAQPRRTFPEAELESLADSIRRHGVLQPLTVRRTGEGWELVAGERRLRAAVLAEQAGVPCLERTADDQSSAALALVENLQRQDLHYLEEAEAIAAFLRRSGLTQEAAAEQLAMSPSTLANKLRLLRLSSACRAAVTEGGLTERHAPCLLRLEDERSASPPSGTSSPRG
jgi:ParB family chromosome partitioning protein